MKIVLFSIFGFNVYSHGVFLVLAAVVGGWILFRLAKKEKFETKNFFANYLTSVVIGLVASRVLFYLINLKYYQTFWQIVEIWQGGLISFAGFIAGAAAFLLILKKQKQSLEPWVEIAGVVFPLAIAIGRVGCVLNGEFGIRTKSIFAIYGYMPVTLLELLACIVIFVINFYLYLNFRARLPKYLLFFNFAIIYLFTRIFIDTYRIDDALAIGINLSQLTSLVLLVVSILTFGYLCLKGKMRLE